MKTNDSFATTTCSDTLAPRLRTACAARLLPLVLLALPAAVQAQFNYTTNNGTITITGYTGSDDAVTIPDTINGLPVTTIAAGAFISKTNLTSVAIGTNVTSIGDSAFLSCYSLTSVTIPNSVTSIGVATFYGCTSLTNVMIGNSVTNMGINVFSYCTSLTAITVDALNPVYSSMAGVLFNQSQTTLILCPWGKGGSFTMPNSVTSIVAFAFYRCTRLASVVIGNSVPSIGPQAFAYCTNLTSVTIGSSVTNIGSMAFRYCTNLTTIAVDALNSCYTSVDGVLFNQSRTALILCPAGKAGGYIVLNSVTSIGAFAFYYCTSLSSITIGNSVTNIGDDAFENCTSLTSVKIPNRVTSIGDWSFHYCASLTNVIIGDSVTSIGQQAFNGCSGLTCVTIGNDVTSIGFGAFQACTNLTSVKIPNRVTSIGDYAFQSCFGLTSVTIGSNVTNIGVYAFAYCSSLTGVYFKGNAPSIGWNVFLGDNNATAYYLPGTTDWGTTFGGRPSVLWNPEVQTSGESFGVQTNQFGFTITGTSGLAIVVEACTNLASPAWLPLQACTLTDGSFYFNDPNWTNYPVRFYRLRSP